MSVFAGPKLLHVLNTPKLLDAIAKVPAFKMDISRYTNVMPHKPSSMFGVFSHEIGTSSNAIDSTWRHIKLDTPMSDKYGDSW